MDARLTSRAAVPPSPPSISEYASDQAKIGKRSLPGAPGTFWARHLPGIFERIPAVYLEPPSPNEVRDVLLRGRAMLAIYFMEPDEHHPVNAWVYVCTDQAYALDQRPKAFRWAVRRGLSELRVRPVPAEQIRIHGVRAYCDTHRRLGLSDGTPHDFDNYITAKAGLKGHVYLGAWKDAQLAAFLSIQELGDGAQIEGHFSATALRGLQPNDTLMYWTLRHYLVERGLRVVCNGCSPIREEPNTAGLHAFKTKAGFTAYPVHRAFVLHPLLRPFANHVTLWSLAMVLRLKPGDRHLQQAREIVAFMLGEPRMQETAQAYTRSASDRT